MLVSRDADRGDHRAACAGRRCRRWRRRAARRPPAVPARRATRCRPMRRTAGDVVDLLLDGDGGQHRADHRGDLAEEEPAVGGDRAAAGVSGPSRRSRGAGVGVGVVTGRHRVRSAARPPLGVRPAALGVRAARSAACVRSGRPRHRAVVRSAIARLGRAGRFRAGLASRPRHGARRSMTQPDPVSRYRSRSCSRANRPCQNSTVAGPDPPAAPERRQRDRRRRRRRRAEPFLDARPAAPPARPGPASTLRLRARPGTDLGPAGPGGPVLLRRLVGAPAPPGRGRAPGAAARSTGTSPRRADWPAGRGSCRSSGWCRRRRRPRRRPCRAPCRLAGIPSA